MTTVFDKAMQFPAPPAESRNRATPRPTITTLRTAPLLAELPEDRLQALAAVAEWQIHGEGSAIVLQNEDSISVFFIISGFAKVMRGGNHAKTVRVANGVEQRLRLRQPVMVTLLGPGDMVGEVASLLNTTRFASVVALTPCQVISIPSREFLACMHHHPPFALAVARKMARRLIESGHQIELMRGDLEGRIHALIRYCRTLGLDIERWLSNAEIARMLGATRVAVSQIVNRLRETECDSGRIAPKRSSKRKVVDA